VRELGADAVVDYAAPGALDAVREAAPDGLDAIADFSGGELAARAIELLVPGRGRLVSIIAPPDPAPLQARGCAALYMFVRPDAADLRTLAAMADAGELRVHLDAVFALDEAADALARVEEGHPRGKVVLRVG
jgi:NADPH:quinone reductase-like Zn-dependent oxidoreductase